ncbi:MAG: hypothetical protein ACPL7G_10425, partial [Chloroflexia bacterium]
HRNPYPSHRNPYPSHRNPYPSHADAGPAHLNPLSYFPEGNPMTEPRWIRASELRTYGYCARAWWLQYVLGLEPEDGGRLLAGEERHLAHGRAVLHAERLRRLALGMLLLGLLLAAVALALRFWAG